MSDERILTFSPDIQQALTRFIRQQFAQEDDVLRAVREAIRAEDLPNIEIRPEEGHMLGFLAHLINAQRILEIGTLAGYSGIWLARALPPGGRLITLEISPRHAAVARRHFALAGLADRVELVEGDALQSLARLADSGLFDMVFIDADKEGYPDYLAWAVAHVRAGGLIAAHNAFRSGRLLDEKPDSKVAATRIFLDNLARDERLISTIIPVGDGLAVGIVR